MEHIKTSHPQTISEDQLSNLVDMCQQRDPPVFERCPLCSWAEEQAMREHLRDKHGSTADINGPVFWECLACRASQIFDERSDLDSHKTEFHADELRPSEAVSEMQAGQRFQCAPCQTPAFFVDEDELQEHLDRAHPGIDDEDRLPAFIEMCGINGSAALRFCPFCSHVSEAPVEVPIQVPDQSSLLDHIAQHIHSFSLFALPWATTRGDDAVIVDPAEIFGKNEYFADDEEASKCAQVDVDYVREAIANLKRAEVIMLQGHAAQLEDDDEEVRYAAIKALQGRPDLTEEILQGIAARLEDDDADVRYTAIEALQGRPDLTEEILQRIVIRLEDVNKDVRQTAVKALYNRPDLTDNILQSIIARLKDKN